MHGETVKLRIYVLSWLITKIKLRCTVSKTSKFIGSVKTESSYKFDEQHKTDRIYTAVFI